MGQRSSDRYLDERIVSGLIAAQFPDLACWPVTRLGGGWDHELFSAGEWVWRFPLRAERVAWLTHEIQITALVAETLGPMIPVFERIGEPSDAIGESAIGESAIGESAIGESAIGESAIGESREP